MDYYLLNSKLNSGFRCLDAAVFPGRSSAWFFSELAFFPAPFSCISLFTIYCLRFTCIPSATDHLYSHTLMPSYARYLPATKSVEK